MKKFAIALMITALTALAAQAQGVEGSITDDGKVAITVDGSVAMSGLNLKSAGGYFVPIPPGTTSAPAAPFTFLLANNANNVSYAAIPGSTVAVEGTLITDVGYTGDAAGVTDDMAASAYGNAAFQQVTFPTTAPVVPEPATGILAAIAGLGLLGFRRRR